MGKGKKYRKRIHGTAKQIGQVFPSIRAVRIKGSKKSKRYHAEDFGDNPKVKGGRERMKEVKVGKDKVIVEGLNVKEPWEVRYAKEKGYKIGKVVKK